MDSQILVKDIMTRQVVSVTTDTPVRDIARLLNDYKISGVPVVDNDKVIGIVTEEDLIMRDAIIDAPHFLSLFDSVFYFGNKKEFEKELTHVLATKASELMTNRVLTIAEDASVAELATLMMKKEVNPVPVIGADGKLAGIVSRADIIRLMVRTDEAEDKIEAAQEGQE